jgi:hypothetical protein
MNTAAYVDEQIKVLKSGGIPLADAAWQLALLCVGWPYVFGDRGQYCTPTNRRAAYNRTAEGKNRDNIKAKCKNFDGTGSCSGCKFYPGGRTREFDCRGFTYWVLLQIFGWKLMGAGATSQWNTASNWKAKGRIADGFPANTLVCLFYSKDNKEKTWEHTGFGYNNETVECSNGVQHFTTRNKKWTHWAIPACIDGETPTPVPPDPGTTKPTLRRGSKGAYVKELQTMLVERGYSVGTYGIDGDYGRATEAAVKEFQKDAGLTADGICGPKTWAALEESPGTELYTVTIPHLPLVKAQAIANQYNGAILVPEGSE